MIKVENIEIFNFGGAMRGLRNPMNSWEKNDTRVIIGDLQGPLYGPDCSEPVVGPNDLKLAQRMLNGGAEESKFMRQIMISMVTTTTVTNNICREFKYNGTER